MVTWFWGFQLLLLLQLLIKEVSGVEPDLIPLSGFKYVMGGHGTIEHSSDQGLKEQFCNSVVPRTYLTAPGCHNQKNGAKDLSLRRPFLITGVGRSGTSYIASLYKGVGLDIHHDNFKDCEKAKKCPGGDGAVSWPQTFSDSSFPLVGNPGENQKRSCRLSKFTWQPNGITFDYIIHLVRDPIKTIDSRWNKGNVQVFREQTVCNTVAEYTVTKSMKKGEERKATLRFTLQHWVLWNLFSEVQSVERIRLEDFSPEAAYNLCVKYSWPGDSLLNKLIINNKPNSQPSKSGTVCPPISKFQSIHEESLVVNHGHTKHMNATTWALLKSLDHHHTLLAQKMALRYGYEIDPLDVLQPVKDPLSKETCGFRKEDGRWQCRLMVKYDVSQNK